MDEEYDICISCEADSPIERLYLERATDGYNTEQDNRSPENHDSAWLDNDRNIEIGPLNEGEEKEMNVNADVDVVQGEVDANYQNETDVQPEVSLIHLKEDISNETNKVKVEVTILNEKPKEKVLSDASSNAPHQSLDGCEAESEGKVGFTYLKVDINQGGNSQGNLVAVPQEEICHLPDSKLNSPIVSQDRNEAPKTEVVIIGIKVTVDSIDSDCPVGGNEEQSRKKVPEADSKDCASKFNLDNNENIPQEGSLNVSKSENSGNSVGDKKEKGCESAKNSPQNEDKALDGRKSTMDTGNIDCEGTAPSLKVDSDEKVTRNSSSSKNVSPPQEKVDRPTKGNSNKETSSVNTDKDSKGKDYSAKGNSQEKNVKADPVPSTDKESKNGTISISSKCKSVIKKAETSTGSGCNRKRSEGNGNRRATGGNFGAQGGMNIRHGPISTFSDRRRKSDNSVPDTAYRYNPRALRSVHLFPSPQSFHEFRNPEGRLPHRKSTNDLLLLADIGEQKARRQRQERDRLLRRDEFRLREESERQKKMEQRTRDEFLLLEREREQLRAERRKIEEKKLELIRLERERQRTERERIEKEKEELLRAKLKLEEESRHCSRKRSYRADEKGYREKKDASVSNRKSEGITWSPKHLPKRYESKHERHWNERHRSSDPSMSREYVSRSDLEDHSLDEKRRRNDTRMSRGQVSRSDVEEVSPRKRESILRLMERMKPTKDFKDWSERDYNFSRSETSLDKSDDYTKWNRPAGLKMGNASECDNYKSVPPLTSNSTSQSGYRAERYNDRSDTGDRSDLDKRQTSYSKGGHMDSNIAHFTTSRNDWLPPRNYDMSLPQSGRWTASNHCGLLAQSSNSLSAASDNRSNSQRTDRSNYTTLRAIPVDRCPPYSPISSASTIVSNSGANNGGFRQSYNADPLSYRYRRF